MPTREWQSAGLWELSPAFGGALSRNKQEPGAIRPQ